MDIDHLRSELTTKCVLFNSTRIDIAVLAMQEAAATARQAFPTARWIGLETSDGDYSGTQFPVGIFDVNGVDLGGRDALRNSFIGWLDDSTEHVYLPFTTDEAVEESNADRHLDIDAIVATIPST